MNKSHNQEMGARITKKAYVTGFILALVLTIISFGLAAGNNFSRKTIMAGLIVAALAQMVVHLHYFLHLDKSSAQRWNVMALLFTALLLFIFVGGTIWVMYTLNSRMM
jgi:cytochrome o ubiquinol oxidase operon protein cyoD